MLKKRAGSPYWQIHIGRKVRVSSRTEDKERAREMERVIRDRLWRREQLDDRGAVAWKDAAKRWLNSSTRPRKRDREILAWLAPNLDEECVADIDADALATLQQLGLDAGWAHSTVDRMMTTVSAVLQACLAWEYLARVPAIPMFRPPSDEPRYLTPAELERLCDKLPMHLALAARFAVHSLLRMRAMTGLEWARVDLKSRRAWVPASQQKAGRTFGFDLTDELVRILRALRMLCGPRSVYVFTWNGQRIDDCNTAAFKAAVKAAGLEPLRWHDLRHTGASWAVQAGMTLQELMVRGDWRDYRSVLRYAHLSPSQTAKAAERVAQWAHTEKTAQRGSGARKRA